MAGEAKTPESPAPAAPAAAAPQPPPSDSPPAAAAAAAPPADAAPAEAPKAPEAQLTLLQQFDADKAKGTEDKPDADKPAGESDKPKAEGDKSAEGADAKPEAKPDEKPAETKPAEAKPDEKAADAKPDDKKAAEPPKLEAVAYEYALPETIKLDDARKTEFHTALDGFRADPTKGAQGLIALHEKAMTEYAQSVHDQQIKTWNDTRKGWVNEVMADEQLGGAGYDTAMGKVAEMRDLFVPEKDRKAFDDFLKITGAGDHPAFLRMLHSAHRLFGEARLPPPDIKPPPDNGRQSRRGLLYDHPRSNPNRQQ